MIDYIGEQLERIDMEIDHLTGDPSISSEIKAYEIYKTTGQSMPYDSESKPYVDIYYKSEALSKSLKQGMATIRERSTH